MAARPTASAGKNRAVGPHFERQLVVVRDLTQTSRIHRVVHAAHRRVHRVHRDKSKSQVGVKILVGGNIAAPTLEAHFHIELAAFGDRGDVDVLVQDLHVAVGFDHAAGHNAGLLGAQVQRLGALAVQLERNLLQVQDDVGCVLDHAGDGLELVQHALNAYCGYGGAFDGAQQRTAQCIADGGAEPALKWLRAELAKIVGQRLCVDCQPLRFLESSPQHRYLSSPARHVRRDAFCGGRASAPSF